MSIQQSIASSACPAVAKVLVVFTDIMGQWVRYLVGLVPLGTSHGGPAVARRTYNALVRELRLKKEMKVKRLRACE